MTCSDIESKESFLTVFGISDLNVILIRSESRMNNGVALCKALFKDFELFFAVIARVVGNEQHIAEHIVDFGEQEFLLNGEGEIVLAQEENIGVVAPHSPVQMASENAVGYCVLRGGNLAVHAEFVVEFAAVNKVNIAAYAAGVNNAEGGAERHAAAEEEFILAHALAQEIHRLAHNLTS